MSSSGNIQWIVGVIPLTSVIVVLFSVIVFLVWHVKQKPRKRKGHGLVTVMAEEEDGIR